MSDAALLALMVVLFLAFCACLYKPMKVYK